MRFRYSSGAMTPWGTYLSILMNDRGPDGGRLSLRALGELVGEDHSNISAMMHGRGTPPRKPPLDAMPHWAKRMKLNDEETKMFLLLAGLEHTPDEVKDLLTTARRLAIALAQKVVSLGGKMNQQAIEDLKFLQDRC